MTEQTEFGRVDDDGTVYVRTSSGERVVGQWPDGDPAAALEFYRKRYDGLVVEVDLLEQRTKSGALSPEEAASTVAKVRTLVDEAQAVGDLEALTQRLDALQPVIEERREARKAERAAKVAESKVAKEAVAVEAEALAQGNDWRNGANRLRELLDVWKGLPRIDKPTDDALVASVLCGPHDVHAPPQAALRRAQREARRCSGDQGEARRRSRGARRRRPSGARRHAPTAT